MNQLPEGWASKDFFDTVVLQRGFDLPISARRTGPIAVLGSNGEVGTHDQRPPSVPVPTLTVGRSGSVGKVGYSKSGCWPLNTTLFASDFCGNDPKYLYHWLQYFDLSQYAQGVSVPTLNRNTFRSVRVSVPPIDEQRAIASVLDQCQEGIGTEYTAEKATLEVKRTAMRELFARGLRREPRKETEIGLVPESWNIKTFAEVREWLQYGTSTRCSVTPAIYPVLRIPNVEAGRVNAVDLKYCDLPKAEADKYLLEDGDLLFIRTNGVLQRLGSTAVYEGKPERALFASYLIRARLKTHVNPKYVSFFYGSEMGTSLVSGRATPASDGKYNLNTGTIDSLPLPQPPSIEEQKEIVTVLEAVERKIQLHEQKKMLLEDLFKGLLHKLMTGEIRVNELDLSALGNQSSTERAVA